MTPSKRTLLALVLTLSGGLTACGGSSDGGDGGDAGAGGSTGDAAPSGDGGGGSGTSADAAAPAGPGAAALAGADGITGTFGGMAHTFTIGPIHVPQQTATVLIGASSAQYPPADSWAIRFLPQLGTQNCNGADGEGDPAVSYRSLANLDANGTTGTIGACAITVTGLAPKFEGSFTATIPTSAGNLEVTDGYFRIAH